MTGNDRTMPLDSRVVMLSVQACETCGGTHAAVGVLLDAPAYRDLVLSQCPACGEMGARVVVGVDLSAGSQLRASVLASDAIYAEMARVRAVPDRRD